MNYKVLYRKYRPDNFDSLIGQDHVIKILQNSIKENKIAHAYLFSGPRGTGKTSTARILAKSINCLDNSSGLACDKCENCLSFNTNPDIIEIDAASNNGVEEIRELINNVKIMPTSLKYKVYIIDEVHMLSQSAFNALLLTLEEPPEHVIFILATTNLESVPITIVSRCQRFDFKRINDEKILERLKYVCDNEKIEYQEDGLQEIATLSDGGLRDALSILDQLSKNSKKITSELVAQEIGSVSNKKIEDLIKFLEQNDVENIEKIFTEFEDVNLNYKVVIKKIIYTLSDIGVKALKEDSNWHIDFDLCKNLIIDLNNLMNKININVDPYLLIKMTILSYINYHEKNVTKIVDNLPKIENKNEIKDDNPVKESPKISNKNNNNIIVNEKLIDIRINNCFFGASKQYLNDIKEKWNDFINNVNDSQVKGLVSDTSVVTASNNYAIIVTSIRHKDIEINQKLKDIELLFEKYVSTKYYLVFIDESKWNEEKNKYITNLKNNYKYVLVPEDNIKEKQKSTTNEDMSDISDVFDLDKIEIE